MFFYFYILVSWILYIVAIPFLIFLSFKDKYKESIKSRFFLYKNPPFSKEDGIWLHMCSFGEVRGAKTFIDKISKDKLRLSVITQTGFSLIKNITKESRYLPFEPLLLFWMKPQKALIVFEAELWYLLFALAKRKGAKTFLVNARISEYSYPRYKKFAWFYKKVFENIDYIYAQSRMDKIRLKSLGAKNVKIAGNIKFASLPKPTKKLIKETSPVICAASTHEGEEGIILKAFREFKIRYPDAQLIIVPRHPERFNKVDKLIAPYAKLHNWSYLKYSQSHRLRSEVILVDKMGELINIYPICDIVIMGGTFIDGVGGHNVAEAAQFNLKIISGKYFFNQKEIYRWIDGIKIVNNERELIDALKYPKLIPNSKIEAKIADIDKIVKEIENVLQDR
ncbi:MAG: 3-deoxy-D-manno-octulosonic acid transferase [Epsilonproteobacteria bacterium]|nr:3-deoxy-D-manno-octulosonic acid transferase [Campylobacterota bacterium]